jgi:hypothetical protein
VKERFAMSGLKTQLAGGVATLADCARLWATLTTDYIPGLKIEIEPGTEPDGQPFVQLSLVDYATIDASNEQSMSVWSCRKFYSPLYLISHTQLFDLLIVGYRVIDKYFATGEDNRPRPA